MISGNEAVCMELLAFQESLCQGDSVATSSWWNKAHWGRLKLYLVFGFQHQQVGDVPERQAKADHLGLCDVARKLANVDDPRWLSGTSYVTFELLAIVAICCRSKTSKWFKTKKETFVLILRIGISHRHLRNDPIYFPHRLKFQPKNLLLNLEETVEVNYNPQLLQRQHKKSGFQLSLTDLWCSWYTGRWRRWRIARQILSGKKENELCLRSNTTYYG